MMKVLKNFQKKGSSGNEAEGNSDRIAVLHEIKWKVTEILDDKEKAIGLFKDEVQQEIEKMAVNQADMKCFCTARVWHTILVVHIHSLAIIVDPLTENAL